MDGINRVSKNNGIIGHFWQLLRLNRVDVAHRIGEPERRDLAPADGFYTPAFVEASMSEQHNSARSSRQPREKSPSWKGGRVVASNGYILVNVGVEHHLADVRGYAYEHRLVAEKKIGRRLKDGEIVHHKDEDKTNNHPDNLEVVVGNAEHFVHHRKRTDLRMPGQENDVITCACGCGESFARFDNSGRPRSFISGHNPQGAPTEAAIVSILGAGQMERTLIAVRLGKSVQAIAVALSKLKRKGRIRQVRRGIWALTGGAENI